jgi:hypothetical protein
VTAEQPYQPALGDWVATSLDGLPVQAFRVVGSYGQAWLVDVPQGARCTGVGPWAVDADISWLEGWKGRARLLVLTRPAGVRPATSEEVQAAKLAQLQAGGL